MSVSKERTVSLWMNTEVAPNARILRKDDTADVVVVGSGIAGLSTAYELSRARAWARGATDAGAICEGVHQAQ
jgi:ribulose 1,5-bisphosphate synthetase/thiazole synthase